MKADKDLIVDRNAVRAIPQLIKMLVPPRETAEGFWSPDIYGAIRLLQSIQRAAFEKGAKAQREADLQSGREFAEAWPHMSDKAVQVIATVVNISAAPLVEFEEEVRCGEEDGSPGKSREGAQG